MNISQVPPPQILMVDSSTSNSKKRIRRGKTMLSVMRKALVVFFVFSLPSATAAQPFIKQEETQFTEHVSMLKSREFVMKLFPKNINTKGRLQRAAIGLVLLIAAYWFSSWTLLIASLFCFFQAIMSWCIWYQIIGKNECPIDARNHK